MSPTKRALDVVVASAALVVMAVPMLVIAVAIRVTMGRPVLFRQQRPGLHGEVFVLQKFRSMRDGDGPDADRLTALGRFLRSTSLDELPELFAVLRGDMSLVGPRPLLVAYLDRYDERQARRHEVRPGLTGWVAVNGRNDLTWEEKLELDVWYVENRSLWLDIKILARTVVAVARRQGIGHDDDGSVPEFLGREAEHP